MPAIVFLLLGTIVNVAVAWGFAARRPTLTIERNRQGYFWPGFAINTLFYAGILWLLSAAPFALRRRRRIKHGLCSKLRKRIRRAVLAGFVPRPDGHLLSERHR